MSYPKRQYVLARKRGRKTSYFYGSSLKELRSHVKDGEEFTYYALLRGAPCKGVYRGRVLVTG